MVFLLIYFDVWSTIRKSLIFFVIKPYKIYFSYRFIQRSYEKRSAIYQNSRSKRIEIKHFAFICTNCTRVQIYTRVQINLLHLESSLEQNCFRVQICTRVQILKHRSHGQKYTRGANLHPGCKFVPGCKVCI